MNVIQNLDLDDDDFFSDIISDKNLNYSNGQSYQDSSQTFSNDKVVKDLNLKFVKPNLTLGKNLNFSAGVSPPNENLDYLKTILHCEDADFDVSGFENTISEKSSRKNSPDGDGKYVNNPSAIELHSDITPDTSNTSPDPQFSEFLSKFRLRKKQTPKYKLKLALSEERNQNPNTSLICTPDNNKMCKLDIKKNEFQTTVKRRKRFPGPAGSLPSLRSGSKEVTEPMTLSDINKPTFNKTTPESSEFPLSQPRDNEFTQSHWLKVEKDLFDKLPNLSKFSISWLQEQVKVNRLPVCQIPFLIALIKSFNNDGKKVFMELKDKTGEISASIHQHVLEENTYFQPDSILILHNITVISPKNEPHLLITPRTLLRVYATGKNGRASYINFCDDKEIIERLSKAVTTSETLSSRAKKKSNPLKDVNNQEENVSTSNLIPITNDTNSNLIKTSQIEDAFWDCNDEFDELLGSIDEEELIRLSSTK